MNSTPFRCMLAANPPDDISPWLGRVYASPKVDGVRCTIQSDGMARLRSNKFIPNRLLSKLLSNEKLIGLDGEISFYLPDGKLAPIQYVTSKVMSENENIAGACFFVFDKFDHYGRFAERTEAAAQQVASIATHFVSHLNQVKIETFAQLEDLENNWLTQGYEGIVLRAANGYYKNGRSTAKEFGMVRWTQSTTVEVKIIEFIEAVENCNVMLRNELGYAERSSAKAGLIPAGYLGAIVAENPLKAGTTFQIGTFLGFDYSMRCQMWRDRKSYVGKLAKIKYKQHGVKDAPRQPVLLAIRDPRDL